MAAEQQSAEAPFLSAAWWKPEKKIAFTVLATFKSNNGPYIAVRLVKPVMVTTHAGGSGASAVEEECEVVRIGNLAGITLARMEALASAKNKYFAVGDKVFLRCTGITAPEKEGHSPSPNFEIEIDREAESVAA